MTPMLGNTIEESLKIKNLNLRRKKIQYLMLIFLFVFVDGGWHYPLIGIFIPLFFILMLLIAFYKGRVSCGWFCPRGSLFEIIIKKISLNHERPKIFKDIRYRRLFFLIFSCLFLFFYLATTFDQISLIKTGRFFVYYYVTVTTLGIILGILFGERTFCLICLEGTILSWLSEGKVVMEVKENCIKCGNCQKVCSLSLCIGDLVGKVERTVRNKDCLKCYQCLDSCPMHALRFK
ncbi:MAG: 4Fe-4S binding protein [bacterium]